MKKVKKVLFAATIIFGSTTASFATIHVVKVSNFQFSPKTTNAVIGDTIVWMWKNGSHTTSSTTIPVGAMPWNAPMDSTHKIFGIRVMIAGTYNYRCNIHPLSMKGVIHVTAGLTAGLHDFSVLSSGNNALINWSINNADDISYFAVKRSTDGDNFSEIARVNPSQLLSYSYADKSTLTGKYTYYEVEMVNKKGNSQLSDIKMFTNENTASKLITSLSPNPISSPGHLMLQFNADTEGSMLVRLYDANGLLVKQTEMTAVKGLNNGHFHLGTLTSGTYYLECTLGTVTEKYTVMYK